MQNISMSVKILCLLWFMTPILSIAAPNGASQDWVREYVASQTSQTTYKVGDSAQGGTVVFTTDGGHHGIVISNTDQSSDATYYQAAPSVSNNALYDASGQIYTDWQLPNSQQWEYICSALYAGQLSNIQLTFNRDLAYWTSTFEELTPNVVVYEKKIRVVQQAGRTRFECVSQENDISTNPSDIARGIRVF